MRPSRDAELEQFKTQIDLREYAASVGFELVRRQSSRHSAVMKHPNGDKLVVSRNASKHYVYFNVHGNDSGSIIDFVQTRERGTLGDVRKTLRSWHGHNSIHKDSAKPPPLLPDLEPSVHDAGRVLAAWMKAKTINGCHPYLQQQRAIPDSVLNDPVFVGRIRIDIRGNAVFPHYDRFGLCGYELKNRGFTGFAPGGTKGLMYSHPRDTDRDMVITETAIDMLSIAAIRGTGQRRFFSLAGQPSPAQIALLQSAATKFKDLQQVTLAFDNDEAGRKMVCLVRSALVSSGAKIIEHLPPLDGQDWNDVLVEKRGFASPHFRTATLSHNRTCDPS